MNSLARSIQNTEGFDFIGIYADMVSTNFTSLNDNIQNWALSRGAVIPEHKSEILHICRRRNCCPPNIRLYNVEVPSVNEMKILGIIFRKNWL